MGEELISDLAMDGIIREDQSSVEEYCKKRGKKMKRHYYCRDCLKTLSTRREIEWEHCEECIEQLKDKHRENFEEKRNPDG